MPNLNTRCEIQYKHVSQDETYGTEKIKWLTKAVVWVEKQDELPSRSESIKNGLAVSALRARIRMRFRRDIDSSMRCKINGETWQIISPAAMIGGRNEYSEMMIEKYSS
ncbi:MAG: phage head closure protein [Nitrosomonas sp.]|nr:phage head closure protein [Nitrosomonas sp.]